MGCFHAGTDALPPRTEVHGGIWLIAVNSKPGEDACSKQIATCRESRRGEGVKPVSVFFRELQVFPCSVFLFLPDSCC